MSAIKPTPQESFSSAGSNRPDATGGCHSLSAILRTAFRARPFVPRPTVRSSLRTIIFLAILDQVYSHSRSSRTSLAHLGFRLPFPGNPLLPAVSNERSLAVSLKPAFDLTGAAILKELAALFVNCPNSRPNWDSITVISCQNCSKHTRTVRGKLAACCG